MHSCPKPDHNLFYQPSCFIRDLKSEIIGRLVDIGGIVDNNCLEVIGRLVDIGGIVDNNCLEVIGRFVDIGGIVDHHCLNFIFIKEKGKSNIKFRDRVI